MAMTPLPRVLEKGFSSYYPFGSGSDCSKNILKDYNFQSFGSQITKILFLACGDLKNAFYATAAKTKRDLHIHLNDHNTSILARNILILKIISEGDFNPENQEDLSFLWDVWYNAEWPESTKTRFNRILGDLLDGALPENVVIPKNLNYQKIKGCWRSWQTVSSQNASESKVLLNETKEGRMRLLIECRTDEKRKDLTENELNFTYSNRCHMFIVNWETNIGNEGLDDGLREGLRDEGRLLFEKGYCHLKKNVVSVCVNPTFLHPTTHQWNSNSFFPFEGYFPLPHPEELDTSVKDGMMLRSCLKILKNLVSSYRQRMKSVKIFFHLEDALEFCFDETAEKFDVIHCSDVVNRLGLINLLLATSRRLSDNSAALLFIQSVFLKSQTESVQKFVEEALCCPLNMIPTMYGFRLVDRVELGSTTNIGFRSPHYHSINLCWQRAHSFRNISVYSSPILTQCLKKLARKCFIIREVGVNNVRTKEEIDNFYQRVFSPLTFHYVTRFIVQRLGDDFWLKDIYHNLNLSSTFDMTRRAMDAWKDGEPILKLSIDVDMNTTDPASCKTTPLNMVCEDQPSKLRLLLVSSDAQVLTRIDPTPNVAEESLRMVERIQRGFFLHPETQYIDNFELRTHKTFEGLIESTTISFLLPSDHTLEATHTGFVFDLASGLPLLLSDLKSARSEKFNRPYPFLSEVIPRENSSFKNRQMKVDSCVESEKEYAIKIKIETHLKVSGLNVSPNEEIISSESSHDITLSLNEPKNMTPLTLSFSHPFLVDPVRATLHRKDRYIYLVLQKALLEPWPCEFKENHKKWVADRLKPWKDGKSINSLKSHISFQYNLQAPSLDEPTLKRVRDLIMSLFSHALNNDQPLSIVIEHSVSGTYCWYLELHRPILTSPDGTPVLMISACDCQLFEKMKKMGKRITLKKGEDFFGFHSIGEHEMSYEIESAEQQLFRYVLRLNSTKILPSAWQEKNLALGDNSPWLATFVSPLYVDRVFDPRFFPSQSSNIQTHVSSEENCCRGCGKPARDLKRCSRCRAVFYCSVECQKGHWKQHKISCNSEK